MRLVNFYADVFMKGLSNKLVPFVMWLLPLSFFAFQFIFRLWPGLMAQEIRDQFAIDATDFGFMASFYYYGYAGMQIPIAILLDRVGTKYIVSTFAILCGLASLLFTYTDDFYLAVFSRFLIGVGSAVGFLGVSKVISQWFDAKHYGMMVGFSFTVGLMGAIYGGKPVSLLIEQYNWQNVANILAIISIIIGVLSFIILRSPAGSKKEEIEKFSFSDFTKLFKSPAIWLLGISNFLMVGSLEGFADVWGVSYMVAAYGMQKAEAAGVLVMIFTGMLFGGPLLTFFANRLGNYTVISACGFCICLLFAFVFLYSGQDELTLSTIFFIIGIMCCYQVVVFSAGAELVSRQNLGVTVAFLNGVNMLGGSFFHTVIGRCMDFFWTGQYTGNIKNYELSTYKYALSVIPILAFVGALMVVFIGIKFTSKDKVLIAS